MLHIVRRYWIVVPIVTVRRCHNGRANLALQNVCEIVGSIGRADRRGRVKLLFV